MAILLGKFIYLILFFACFHRCVAARQKNGGLLQHKGWNNPPFLRMISCYFPLSGKMILFTKKKMIIEMVRFNVLLCLFQAGGCFQDLAFSMGHFMRLGRYFARGYWHIFYSSTTACLRRAVYLCTTLDFPLCWIGKPLDCLILNHSDNVVVILDVINNSLVLVGKIEVNRYFPVLMHPNRFYEFNHNPAVKALNVFVFQKGG